jgi:threonine synthase
VAGAIRDIRSGKIPEGSTVTCTLTGHGLKDPDTAIAQSSETISVDADEAAIRKVIEANMAD